MLKLLFGGAALYGAAVAGLYWLQDHVLFPRGEADIAKFPLPRAAMPIELQVDGGMTLHGHLLPARQPSRGLMLGFPGNSWNADDFLFFLGHHLPDFDLVAFHYRGYGPSDGRPGQAALLADGLAIHDAMVRRLQPRAVYTAGFSLGTGVAAYLASLRPVAGALLVTPFDSVAAVARQRYPWAPVGQLLRHPFRSDRYLRGVDVPVAMLMAGDDVVVPPARSEALLKVLARPVFSETITEVGHSALYEDPRFDDALARAMLRLEQAAALPAAPGRHLDPPANQPRDLVAQA